MKLPVREPAPSDQIPESPLEPGDQLLVWTTTPWTLISNAAVAAGPEIEYVRAQVRRRRRGRSSLARARVEKVLGEGAEVLGSLPGRGAGGHRYEPPFDYITDYGPRGHTVLLGDFVTTDEGTGLVHTAIAFGEDDFRLGEQYGMTLQNPVRLDGTFDERVTDFAGPLRQGRRPRHRRGAAASGAAAARRAYEHAYPHCWRCDTPLLYYAKSSWYIRTTEVRDRMLAENERIGWHPEHIKHGRFGKWLESNVDWALSRDRYWGTPLPIWECDGEDCERALLRRLDRRPARARRRGPRRPPPPLHRRGRRRLRARGLRRRDAARPRGDRHLVRLRRDAVRAVPLPVRERGGVRASASRPTSSARRSTRPAAGSTRCSPSRRCSSTRPSYRNCVCLGLILDPEGQKMSKSRGNVVDPVGRDRRHGADAFRWYYLTSQQPWAGYRFSVETVGESVRQFLLTLWNTYSFWVLYANAEGIEPRGPPATARSTRRTRRTRRARPLGAVAAAGDDRDGPRAARRLRLTDARGRRSPPTSTSSPTGTCGSPAAASGTATGRVRDAAPLPARDGEAARAVHPVPRRRDLLQPRRRRRRRVRRRPGLGPPLRLPRARRGAPRPRARGRDGGGAPHGRAGPRRARPGEGEDAPAAAQGGDRRHRGRSARRSSGSPTSSAPSSTSRSSSSSPRRASSSRYRVKPNFRSLGPRFGKDMPQVAAAIEALDADHVARGDRRRARDRDHDRRLRPHARPPRT